MKPDKKEEKDFEERYYNINNSIASANEYTGLIPSAVESEQESESYCDEFKIHEQEKVEFNEKGKDSADKK